MNVFVFLLLFIPLYLLFGKKISFYFNQVVIFVMIKFFKYRKLTSSEKSNDKFKKNVFLPYILESIFGVLFIFSCIGIFVFVGGNVFLQKKLFFSSDMIIFFNANESILLLLSIVSISIIFIFIFRLISTIASFIINNTYEKLFLLDPIHNMSEKDYFYCLKPKNHIYDLGFLTVLFLVILIMIFSPIMSYGYVSHEGFVFKKYFIKEFIEWQEISKISYNVVTESNRTKQSYIIHLKNGDKHNIFKEYNLGTVTSNELQNFNQILTKNKIPFEIEEISNETKELIQLEAYSNRPILLIIEEFKKE